ncbi:uncharacterized protein KRP23_14051 [Phytophthora ramorum]|uniref:uncharacterized protein n=1 Tax=Phytophthora ramorum TaxID=164328 RepID=UPI0030A16E61|nr:hypothetical protein KRP23_13990 [Phytophthora ramorum]KAH7462191.1 hypothetical protein KRP23_14051 [Phytophthora ramorum]
MGEKRFKSAYFMRKQVKEDLKEEVRRLQDELAQLNPVPNVEHVKSENTAIRSAIRQQQIDVARVQSAISPLLENHPLYSRIHLKKSWEERSATLLGLREKKLGAAYEYVSMRSEVTRWDQPQLSDERFETATGDTCCVIFQTVHFRGVSSLKQVYDALLFSINHAEISISERLGHVTVRDDYDSVEGKVYNARIVSTNDIGATTELNCIMFSQLLDETNDICSGEPCGMVVIDSVDEDELYPYLSSERVRKDVSAAFVLTTNQLQTEGDELVVTLRRAASVKLHCPEFEMAEAVWQELQQDAARWGDVILRSIRGVLYSMP